MPDYTAYTHEQLVQEINKKETSRKKLKASLLEIHDVVNLAKTQITRLTAERSALTLQHDSKAQECQQLQSELKAVTDSREEAVESAAAHQRTACRLDQDLKLEQKRSALLDKGKKQAEAAKAELEMRYQQQASDIASLRVELSALQSAFKTIQQQQQTDHHAISELSADKPQHGLALVEAQACQDCVAARGAIADFRQRLDALEANKAEMDHKKAQSVPSTQDRSGDTNDDRGLRSDVDHIFLRLRACERSHQGVAEQINSWRTLFSVAGTSVMRPGQDAAEQMQISPVGAEGSNVMPGQPARMEAAEVRRGAEHSNLHAHLRRDGTPHAGSTAGDCEDIARHDTLGGGSDCLSDVIGTSASLMQAALPRPVAAVRVRPPHAIDGTNDAINRLHSKIIAEQVAADSPKVTSPKRKAIALEPGPVQPVRKRRKQAAKPVMPAQPHVHPTQLGPNNDPHVHPFGDPLHQQQEPAKQGCSKAFLTRFGIEQPDATVVDFLELQLGRITHAHQHGEEEDMAEVVSLVVHDIHAGWALQECPLECIMAQFVTSITNCAAAPPSHDSGSHSQLSDPSERESSPDGEEAGEARCFEDMPLARLWCSPSARKHHILTWLLHCASQLDGLLSTPPPAPCAPSQPTAGQPTGGAASQAASGQVPAATASQNPAEGPVKKRRGRPPGSKNKKTLQKLEAQGLPINPPAPRARPSQQKQKQQQQHEASASRASQQTVKKGAHSLQQLEFLTGLHKKVLQALGEACDPKRSGPFEAEVCCLSAAAALLCRVMGKVQPVTAQIVGVLRSFDLPPHSKLHCVAAALEQHPDALATPLPAGDPQDATAAPSLVDLCCHAALQRLSEQASHDSKPAAADATAAPPNASATSWHEGEPQEATAAPSAEAGELVTGVSGRTAIVVQSWSRNRLTQTAASHLHAQYHQHWERLQQNCCSEASDSPVGGAVPQAGKAGKLWAVAETAILTQLQSLGTASGSRGDAADPSLWQAMHVALDIAIVHLGWEWAYYKVVDQGMSHALAGVLQSPAEDTAHVAVAMKHLLACLKHVTQCMASVFSEEPSAWTQALLHLAGRLKLLAQNQELAHQPGVEEQLTRTAVELLDIKLKADCPSASIPQQKRGVQQPAKYDLMDVEVEEI